MRGLSRTAAEPAGAVPLALRGAAVEVPGARLLHDADVAVGAGEAVALLGANGSGKSTLLRAALGQLPLSGGDAELFGVSTRHHPGQVPWDRVGYVPQRVSTASPIPATALEVVQTGLLGRTRWWVRRRDRDRALAAMEQVGVSDLAGRAFGVLSGGQAQRVAIARALARQPELLLLDEPLAGVDLLTQTSLATLLRDLHSAGATIVMVLHELGPFTQLIERAVVLRGGEVVHDGPLSAQQQPSHDHLHPGHGDTDHHGQVPTTQRTLP